MLAEAALTDGNLDAVIAFLRDANPFAQHTWGWDTGRFIDWRWGHNELLEAESPGWLAEHCRIFSDAGGIRAVAVTEKDGEETYVITSAEDPTAVRHALDRLLADHAIAAPVVHASYLPAENDGHDASGFTQGVDLVYAYPWPAEETRLEETFLQLASPGTLLMTYHGGGLLRLRELAATAE